MTMKAREVRVESRLWLRVLYAAARKYLDSKSVTEVKWHACQTIGCSWFNERQVVCIVTVVDVTKNVSANRQRTKFSIVEYLYYAIFI